MATVAETEVGPFTDPDRLMQQFPHGKWFLTGAADDAFVLIFLPPYATEPAVTKPPGSAAGGRPWRSAAGQRLASAASAASAASETPPLSASGFDMALSRAESWTSTGPLDRVPSLARTPGGGGAARQPFYSILVFDWSVMRDTANWLRLQPC